MENLPGWTAGDDSGTNAMIENLEMHASSVNTSSINEKDESELSIFFYEWFDGQVKAIFQTSTSIDERSVNLYVVE